MAKLYTPEKEDTRQKENTYMLYMIIGSYFHKCRCKSRIMEEKLFLYYTEMNEKHQGDCEEKIIERVENNLDSRLSEFSEMNCEVSISQTAEQYRLVFYTGFEGVTVCVDGKGQYDIQFLN